MTPLHSHTHCQAAHAIATTQAWQRVCLSYRTTKPTDKLLEEEKHRTGNSVFATMAGDAGKSAVVHLINICRVSQFSAPKPPQRKYAIRYASCYDETTDYYKTIIYGK